MFLAISAAFAVTALLSAGILSQSIGMRRDAERLPPPGRFVQTEAGSFHLLESGSGRPSVILESGLAGSSLSWAMVQSEIGQFARVCSYDRAGFGWSTPIRSPRVLGAVVEELARLLETAGIPAPYILVGHSYGGLIVRAFAHQFPHLTAGLILVDPVSTKYWASCSSQERVRLNRGVHLARRGAVLAHLGVIRLVLNLLIARRRFLPEAVARLSAPGAGSFLERLTREIQKLPPSLWPSVRAQWSRPMGFRSICAYLEALPQNCLTAESTTLATRVPMTVLSASTATDAEREERENWLGQSLRGRHLSLSDSGHWIQIEQPSVVIEAVREMVCAHDAGQTFRGLPI